MGARWRWQAWLVLGLLATCASVARGDDVIPADPRPTWWKGNLHTHSLWSDGNDFPEMIAQWYRDAGYHFLALSDHNILSEGVKWMKASDIARRSSPAMLARYRARFGDWVETRGDVAAPDYAVRLKPLDEFRHLVEERGRFLMLPSEEISDQVGQLPLHLNVTNLRDLIRPLGGKTIREALAADLRAVEEQSQRSGREMLAHLNHPNFHFAVTAEDLAAVIQERFFEVFNGHTGVNNDGDPRRAGTEEIWDVANTLRLAQLDAPPLYGLATDDSHDYHPAGRQSPGRGWVMVRAKRLTPESLLKAMKAGDFYASTGVVLRDVRFNAETKALSLDIDPQPGATYVTRFIGSPRGVSLAAQERVDLKGKPLVTTKKYAAEIGRTFHEAAGTSVSYQLTGQELYIRAVVTSSLAHTSPTKPGQRQQAWTQPVGWSVTAGKKSELPR